MTTATLDREHEVADPLDFSVTDVTGMQTLEIEGVDGHRHVTDVASSIAELMDLPTTSPYGLRDDAHARMLVDDRALGSQVQKTGARLVVIPRAHLG